MMCEWLQIDIAYSNPQFTLVVVMFLGQWYGNNTFL